MSRSKFAIRFASVLTAIALLTATACELYAQSSSRSGNNSNSNSSGNSSGGRGGRSGGSSGNNNNSGGGRGGNSSGGNSDSGGGMYGSGVIINTEGLLQRVMSDNGSLDRARLQAEFKQIPSDLRTPSSNRKVSLTRLEKAIIANGGMISDEMQNLAGLTKIENVFVYPETGDVVIAGPAEGWTIGTERAVVGYKSGKPTLQLDDMIVALRAFPPTGKDSNLIGCSIDPSQEGLVSMRNYLGTQRHPNVSNPQELSLYAEGIRNSLGRQNVTVWGVSPKTNFAATLVAADYRMKLIGIGLETPPVRMTTYAEKSTPATIASNALVRWFFQPDYHCVVMTENGLGIQLVGDSVQLIGEDELVTKEGNRVAAKGSGNRATKMYAKSFTDKFASIAKVVPVYANLRNLIDMSVVAAYLKKEDIYKKTNWSMEFFSDEKKFAVEYFNPVRYAETAVNILHHGRSGSIASFPTGGGVMIQPNTALNQEYLRYDEDGAIGTKREASQKTLSEGQWWWD